MVTAATPQKIAAFDIDGTLFRWQLFHELVFALKNTGQFNAATEQEIDEHFLAWTSRKISFDEYEKSVLHAVKMHIPHISIATLEAAAAGIIEASSHKVYKFTREYIKQLKKEGYFLLAISGSHQEIVQPFADLYGFDDCIGVLLERRNGAFTGEYERIVYGRKAELIKEYVAAHNLTLDDSVAVGDSAGDISMLEIVETPIAFNPAFELLETAVANKWKVIIERKNVAYMLQEGTDGTYVLAQADRL
jgi:HAD superfamily hydrolase (TIGR01490 family)